MNMLQQLYTAVMMLAVLTVLTGGVYPLVVTGIAETVFPHAARGSLVERTDRQRGTLTSEGSATNRYDWGRNRSPTKQDSSLPVASELIGQPFSKPEYFWGRLSATSPFPYNAAASSGSNLGPQNPALQDAVKSRIAALIAAGSPGENVPVDLVTASGSGLDPHISPAAAEFQLPRVAAARGMKEYVVRDLVVRHTEGRQWGVLGEPRVNVVSLNLALDHLQHEK
jgi:potassium-transporting ATPase KdpC subunit